MSCRLCDGEKKLKVQKICLQLPDIYTLGNKERKKETKNNVFYSNWLARSAAKL